MILKSPQSGAIVKYSFITFAFDGSFTNIQAKNISIENALEISGVNSGDTIYIYNLYLKEGENRIEVSGNNSEGILVKETVVITSAGKGIPPVLLKLDKTKDFTSLTTQAKVIHGSLLVDKFLIDRDGNGVIDIKTESNTLQLNYSSTGAYHPKVTVLTEDGIYYSSYSANNEAVNVLDNPESRSTVIEGINTTIYDLEEDSEHIFALAENMIYKISKNNPNTIQEIIIPSLTTPQGFAFDREGNIFIADTGADRVIKLIASENYQEGNAFILNVAGSEVGQLLSPQGVTITGKGEYLEVYVLDTGNNRVQIFDSKGKYLAKFDGSTTADGKLNNPLNMINGSSPIITDYGNNMVRELSFNRQTQEEVSRRIVTITNMGKAVFSEQGQFIPDNANKKLLEVSNQGEILNSIPMGTEISIALSYSQGHQLIYQEKGSNQLKHIYIPKTTLENAPLALSKKFVQAYLANDIQTILKFTPLNLLQSLKHPDVVDKANTIFPQLEGYEETVYMYGKKAVVDAQAPALPNEVTLRFSFVWQNGRWLLEMVR